ncbi:flagellar motor switch protein FliN [Burkholderia sp. SRS-W-2-2016]|uniref:flagellar motor switch protein FliN n=1 Tax=Burkholderia sp. SRS-W-2-2016 TaxID=1926878 RepID=UPI00094B3957|nr:flagellar motor switch protein FliN [Burkholderia sp. SRS-W-2-2016]OLL30874.1 flagellar motor switch protein FliN [Burkholderia sp. SRS-W-2-2016]
MTLSTSPTRPLVMRVDLPDQQPALVEADEIRPQLSLLEDVKVTVDIRLGCADMSVKELMALQAGAVVELDRYLGDTVEVLLNNKTIARAEIVALGEQFGIRITEISATP